jgi:hypothetical protein
MWVLCRYLRYLQLTLIKKKALNEWKQEQLSAKRQLQDDILVSDILNSGEAAVGDSALNSSTGGEGTADARRAPGSSEKNRAAAKARIAAWRAAQAKQLEDEKVREGCGWNGIYRMRSFTSMYCAFTHTGGEGANSGRRGSAGRRGGTSHNISPFISAGL